MAEMLEVFVIKNSITVNILKNRKILFEAVTIMTGRRLSQGYAH